VAIFDSETPLGYSTMTDQDAAAHPPSLFTSLKTTDIHTNTPYDATRMPTRLQRMSQLFNETHITVAIFDSESPLGYSTMTDQDAAARPPSLSTSLKTTDIHTDTPYDATRTPTRLQRPSPLQNDPDTEAVFILEQMHNNMPNCLSKGCNTSHSKLSNDVGSRILHPITFAVTQSQGNRNSDILNHNYNNNFCGYADDGELCNGD
jgi:hypothetical protein